MSPLWARWPGSSPRLSPARIDAGLTQEELAELLGTTSITVYRWERGENIPTPYFRARLCRLFQTSESALGWSMEEEEEASRSSSAFLLDPCLPTSQAPLGQQTLIKEVLNSHHHLLGLVGLPGSGKTTIALALARRRELRQRFTGILWASVGREPNPLRHLRRWLRLVGGKERPERLEDLQDQLRLLTNGRRMLLLLDDLWEAGDISPYQIGPLCDYVVTTRLPGLAHIICDAIYHPRPLTENQALNLLTNGLPSTLSQEHRDILRALSQQVGLLPGALEQINRYLRRETASHSQRRLQEALARLFHPTTYLNLQVSPSASSLSALLKRSEEQLPSSTRQALSFLAATTG